MVNTDSTTFTVRWVIFPDKIVSRFFQIFIIRYDFGIETSFGEANNFVDRNYADRKEIFVNMCADMLFKFQ